MDPVLTLEERLTRQDRHLIFRHQGRHTHFCLKGKTGSMRLPHGLYLAYGVSAIAFDGLPCQMLAEIHDYDISLTTLVIESIIQILSELDQMCFTADPAPEAMLI